MLPFANYRAPSPSVDNRIYPYVIWPVGDDETTEDCAEEYCVNLQQEYVVKIIIFTYV